MTYWKPNPKTELLSPPEGEFDSSSKMTFPTAIPGGTSNLRPPPTSTY